LIKSKVSLKNLRVLKKQVYASQVPSKVEILLKKEKLAKQQVSRPIFANVMKTHLEKLKSQKEMLKKMMEDAAAVLSDLKN